MNICEYENPGAQQRSMDALAASMAASFCTNAAKPNSYRSDEELRRRYG